MKWKLNDVFRHFQHYFPVMRSGETIQVTKLIITISITSDGYLPSIAIITSTLIVAKRLLEIPTAVSPRYRGRHKPADGLQTDL